MTSVRWKGVRGVGSGLWPREEVRGTGAVEGSAVRAVTAVRAPEGAIHATVAVRSPHGKTGTRPAARPLQEGPPPGSAAHPPGRRQPPLAVTGVPASREMTPAVQAPRGEAVAEPATRSPLQGTLARLTPWPPPEKPRPGTGTQPPLAVTGVPATRGATPAVQAPTGEAGAEAATRSSHHETLPPLTPWPLPEKPRPDSGTQQPLAVTGVPATRETTPAVPAPPGEAAAEPATRSPLQGTLARLTPWPPPEKPRPGTGTQPPLAVTGVPATRETTPGEDSARAAVPSPYRRVRIRSSNRPPRVQARIEPVGRSARARRSPR